MPFDDEYDPNLFPSDSDREGWTERAKSTRLRGRKSLNYRTDDSFSSDGGASPDDEGSQTDSQLSSKRRLSALSRLKPCDTCYYAKLKCNKIASGSCSGCVEGGISCTYVRRPGRPGGSMSTHRKDSAVTPVGHVKHPGKTRGRPRWINTNTKGHSSSQPTTARSEMNAEETDSPHVPSAKRVRINEVSQIIEDGRETTGEVRTDDMDRSGSTHSLKRARPKDLSLVIQTGKDTGRPGGDEDFSVITPVRKEWPWNEYCSSFGTHRVASPNDPAKTPAPAASQVPHINFQEVHRSLGSQNRRSLGNVPGSERLLTYSTRVSAHESPVSIAMESPLAQNKNNRNGKNPNKRKENGEKKNGATIRSIEVTTVQIHPRPRSEPHRKDEQTAKSSESSGEIPVISPTDEDKPQLHLIEKLDRRGVIPSESLEETTTVHTVRKSKRSKGRQKTAVEESLYQKNHRLPKPSELQLPIQSSSNDSHRPLVHSPAESLHQTHMMPNIQEHNMIAMSCHSLGSTTTMISPQPMEELPIPQINHSDIQMHQSFSVPNGSWMHDLENSGPNPQNAEQHTTKALQMSQGQSDSQGLNLRISVGQSCDLHIPQVPNQLQETLVDLPMEAAVPAQQLWGPQHLQQSLTESQSPTNLSNAPSSCPSVDMEELRLSETMPSARRRLYSAVQTIAESDSFAPPISNAAIGAFTPDYKDRQSHIERNAAVAPETSLKVDSDLSAHLIAVYFAYVHPTFRRLIQPITFLRKWKNSTKKIGPIVPKCLLHAMYAVSGRFSMHPALRNNPDTCVSKGKVKELKLSYIAKRFADIAEETVESCTDSISRIQTYVLLAVWEAAQNAGHKSLEWMGKASENAHVLKSRHSRIDRRFSSSNGTESELRRILPFLLLPNYYVSCMHEMKSSLYDAEHIEALTENEQPEDVDEWLSSGVDKGGNSTDARTTTSTFLGCGNTVDSLSYLEWCVEQDAETWDVIINLFWEDAEIANDCPLKLYPDDEDGMNQSGRQELTPSESTPLERARWIKFLIQNLYPTVYHFSNYSKSKVSKPSSSGAVERRRDALHALERFATLFRDQYQTRHPSDYLLQLSLICRALRDVVLNERTHNAMSAGVGSIFLRQESNIVINVQGRQVHPLQFSMAKTIGPPIDLHSMHTLLLGWYDSLPPRLRAFRSLADFIECSQAVPSASNVVRTNPFRTGRDSTSWVGVDGAFSLAIHYLSMIVKLHTFLIMQDEGNYVRRNAEAGKSKTFPHCSTEYYPLSNESRPTRVESATVIRLAFRALVYLVASVYTADGFIVKFRTSMVPPELDGTHMCDESVCGCVYWDGFWTADRELLDSATGLAAPIRFGSVSTSSSVPLVPLGNKNTHLRIPHQHRSIPFSPILSLTKSAAGLQKLSDLPFTPTMSAPPVAFVEHPWVISAACDIAYQALHVAYNTAIRIYLKNKPKQSARSTSESQTDRAGGMVGAPSSKDHLINLILDSTDGILTFWACTFLILPTMVNVGRVYERGWQYADIVRVLMAKVAPTVLAGESPKIR
ncbi:hypothetical protein BJ742DRAFT_143560 [Cladochytrium replicatum]|nr:hypothetical protein BJ742DRAFT_143560 [Cladochytrium replicatum]